MAAGRSSNSACLCPPVSLVVCGRLGACARLARRAPPPRGIGGFCWRGPRALPAAGVIGNRWTGGAGARARSRRCPGWRGREEGGGGGARLPSTARACPGAGLGLAPRWKVETRSGAGVPPPGGGAVASGLESIKAEDQRAVQRGRVGGGDPGTSRRPCHLAGCSLHAGRAAAPRLPGQPCDCEPPGWREGVLWGPVACVLRVGGGKAGAHSPSPRRLWVPRNFRTLPESSR